MTVTATTGLLEYLVSELHAAGFVAENRGLVSAMPADEKSSAPLVILTGQNRTTSGYLLDAEAFLTTQVRAAYQSGEPHDVFGRRVEELAAIVRRSLERRKRDGITIWFVRGETTIVNQMADGEPTNDYSAMLAFEVMEYRRP